MTYCCTALQLVIEFHRTLFERRGRANCFLSNGFTRGSVDRCIKPQQRTRTADGVPAPKQ